jgi:hypothetical protein
MIDDLIPIFGILLAMIPVAGLTLGLTLRLAVKPFVETLASAVRDAGGRGVDTGELTALVAALQEDVDALRLDAAEIRRAQEFDRKLLGADADDVAGTPTIDPR